MKKHEENKDLQLVSRNNCTVNRGNKTITVNSFVGLKTLGRLDYLHKCHDWFIIFSNKVGISQTSDTDYKANKKALRKNKRKNNNVANYE